MIVALALLGVTQKAWFITKLLFWGIKKDSKVQSKTYKIKYNSCYIHPRNYSLLLQSTIWSKYLKWKRRHIVISSKLELSWNVALTNRAVALAKEWFKMCWKNILAQLSFCIYRYYDFYSKYLPNEVNYFGNLLTVQSNICIFRLQN